jgi:hypothetical protein
MSIKIKFRSGVHAKIHELAMYVSSRFEVEYHWMHVGSRSLSLFRGLFLPSTRLLCVASLDN